MTEEVAKWRSGNSATRQRCIPILGLLIFFALAVNTAVLTSPTVDESVHIFRGRVLWQTGQLRFQAKHTPLAHWLNGSLLFTEPTLPDVADLPSWAQDDRPTLAREFLWESEPQPNIDRVFLLARLPIIWLGLLLGAILARWARAISGVSGPAVALVLFAFSPNLLANFSLATTDGPLAAMFVMAVFAWRRYGQRPSFWRWLLAGTLLGLALGSKLTAVILPPILLLLSYSQWRRGQPWWKPGLDWLSILPVAGLVFWALYGFELRPLPGIPFPVPAATYVNSFLQLQGDASSGNYNAYLLGKISRNGWWYYFVVAFLIKTPLPTLLLLGTAVIFIFRQRNWRGTIYLWLPAAILFAFASYSRLNIGYRHILPVLPFIILLTTIPIKWLISRPRSSVSYFVLALLLGWYSVGSLRQHPHHLAYFNELSGGPTQGYRYLADSNIDWGQSLKFLADYVNEMGDKPAAVSYFGAADPAYYGLETTPLFDDKTGAALDFARANPAPGKYLISVNHLLGQALPDVDTFDWFRYQEPVDNVGYSILIYDVLRQEQGSWMAYCTDPAPLLDAVAAAQLVGQSDLRQIYFDCRSSWVFPDDGAPGWYILPQQDSWPVASYFPERLRPVYSHAASALESSYTVWYWDGMADLAAWTAVTNIQADLPARFGETADLTGAIKTESTWWTIWQVQTPPTEPLTIAAHLYADGPTPIVADGLGFTSEQWQPGDWLVQMHSFEAGVNGRYLETGLYNYLTGERLAQLIQLPSPDDEN